MDIEIIISEVKKLSDEEIVNILDRLDDEKAQLGTECMNFLEMGNNEAAGECMEEYFRTDKLRNFVRSLYPLQSPKKQIPANFSGKQVPKSWELYVQGEKKV